MITNAIDAVKEFNKAFKIETSMTPTEYIKNLQSFHIDQKPQSKSLSV